MAFTPTFKTRILNGDFSLSAKSTSVSLPLSVDMLDITTLADTSKRFLPGVDTSTIAIEGFVDDVTAADNAAWTTNQPLTYGYQGIALGDPVLMVNAIRSGYEAGSSVAGVASFTLGAQTDGATSITGRSLHDLTAETATANGTGYDQTTVTTTAGGVGHLHVTAFSGFTNIIVTIQDSADNVTFGTTLATFATVTGVTSERIEFTGTVRRYVRASWTKVGTGSCTFAVSFARN